MAATVPGVQPACNCPELRSESGASIADTRRQSGFTSLNGYRVAVTSARRADELCALLRRHGAEVCAAPAITMVDLAEDGELHRGTEELISGPPDILIVTTGGQPSPAESSTS